LSVRPASEPRVPLWIGANADSAVRRAARLADAWLINPHTTLPTVRRQLDMFADERRRSGLPAPDTVPVVREVLCATRSEDARRLAERYLGAKYRAYSAWGQDKVLPDGESFEGAFGDLASRRFVVGDPDECLRQLMTWRSHTGADHFILRSHWSGMPVDVAATSLKLLSREVLPELRSAPLVRQTY
ncbi:MAG: LLM class flavin-dependent oxidoreductase, partial [Sciscionella sp.]